MIAVLCCNFLVISLLLKTLYNGVFVPKYFFLENNACFSGPSVVFFVIGFIPHSAVADAMETVAMQLAASEAIVQEHVGVS